jgi:hypothetical protein
LRDKRRGVEHVIADPKKCKIVDAIESAAGCLRRLAAGKDPRDRRECGIIGGPSARKDDSCARFVPQLTLRP